MSSYSDNATHQVADICKLRKLYGLGCRSCLYEGYRLCPESGGQGLEIPGSHGATTEEEEPDDD